ncbi:protein NSP-INTERACTING KINASE 1 [Populus alba x Populus x berolinensis]|nr:protein NSP-INTERACTING KINASE 1 [Populus alba x Populus x berolinensis]
MEAGKKNALFCCVASLICLWTTAYGELTAAGVNYEVEALMGFKNSLHDPHNILNWDEHAVDPCSWAMVTCSPDNFVTSLGAPSQRLSGTLSPYIGNLTNLQSL